MAPSPAPVASLRTAKELVAFPAGALYYKLVFAYTMTNTIYIRLERTPSAQLITACLAQYGGALQALCAPPQSKETVLTTRTWRSHQGTPYQAVVLLLQTQASCWVLCPSPFELLTQ
jgi:ABC-type cobalamin transport system permease subunit